MTININAHLMQDWMDLRLFCETSTTTIDLFSLIAGEQSGGVWTQVSGTGGAF
jgi:valyl-tRNA synthetase